MKDRAQPIITVHGEQVALGPLRRDLVPLYQAWINDLRVTRTLRNWPMTLDAEFDWYESVAKSRDSVHFTIYEMPSYRPIGNCGFHDIDFAHRTAALGIAIGETDARGKGNGTEAVRLLCDYGFNALNLHSVMLVTYAWNIAGQRAYGKVGFKEIGRRRQSRFADGRYHDDIYYDLLASEFESPVVKRIMRDGET